MLGGGGASYHRSRAGASERVCPLCPREPDRTGWCRTGHPAVQVRGVTYVYEDWRHNVAVDPDAPVLAWRNDKGKRLAWENSREALVWSVFRALEVHGVARPTLAAAVGVAGEPELLYWARRRDATPWPIFQEARAALERWIKGPDVNGADPDVVIIDGEGRQVLFVDAELAAPVAARAPHWFAPATTPSERRVKRAILEAMTAEDETLFRRGLDDAMKRGFWRLARRLLLARACARRAGATWSGRLISLINPATMRRAEDDVARFGALLADGRCYRALTWGELLARVPPGARGARMSGRASLDDYVRARTVNRTPARLLP